MVLLPMAHISLYATKYQRGLDTSAVSKFTDAAILLGNNHSVAGRRSDTGEVIPIAQLNTSNQIAIGDASHTIKMLGPTILDKGSLCWATAKQLDPI